MMPSLTTLLEKVASLTLKQISLGNMVNIGLNMDKQRGIAQDRKAKSRPAILETMRLAVGDLAPIHEKQAPGLKKTIDDIFLDAPVIKAKMIEQGVDIGPKR
jgi:hypothetical protein